MKGQNTFLETLATPEQILGIFRDWQRLELGNALDKKAILSFDTTVRDWRADCDLAEWQTLGEALNRYFGTTFSRNEWRATMKSEKQKTLRNVCVLVATRATLPKLNELKVLGKPCRLASAFFALITQPRNFTMKRSRLRVAGVDASQIRPSSKLDSFLRLETQTAVKAISILAPGKMPMMKTKLNLGHRLSGWACLAGLVSLIGGSLLEKPEWTVVGCLVLGFGLIAITVFSNLPPAKVRLEGCETFADLSRLIAN